MDVGSADFIQTARVVLIEDDVLIRLGQETLLRDWGHRVATATSRDAIQEELKDNPGDVAAIIADFDIGGPHTGVDIALAIAAAAGRRIPTAIMSASFGQSSGTAAALQGFAFFSKPVDPQELCDWLAAVIVMG
jgi:two-component system, sensor histidine kinase